MVNIRGLDFETYGSVDLSTHGMARYMADPNFQPLTAQLYWRAVDGSSQTKSLNFILDPDGARQHLLDLAVNPEMVFAAHNAPFEQAVLEWLGISVPSKRFIDTAVLARIEGAGTHLEAAAPQLLGVGKVEMGKQLIKLFSIPGPYQEKNGDLAFDPQIMKDHSAEWEDFEYYCSVDAQLSWLIANEYPLTSTPLEEKFIAVTADMNRVGWHVDMEMVRLMRERYEENLHKGLQGFRLRTKAETLNLNSHKQLTEWCKDRGINAKSFDEKNIARMKKALIKKLGTLPEGDLRDGYIQVLDLFNTKQLLGGSSLKKLSTIEKLVLPQPDGSYRLMDQYAHAGAAQTLRTSGRGAQLQNLKRLNEEPANMETLRDPDYYWGNEKLASNLRQVFTSKHPQGALIVGDYKSVESRGLAWVAGEDWKTQAYREGKDVYMMQAAKIFNIHYDDVLKPQRQTGKVGELSCGYGAGADAVQGFAEGMGIEMSTDEAAKLVIDWRAANPETVNFWWRLDDMLHKVVTGYTSTEKYALPDRLILQLSTRLAPLSLRSQDPHATHTLVMQIFTSTGTIILRRLFHGVRIVGRNVRYYKAADRKTGDLWRDSYTDPKTGQLRYYELYGGKLTGILIQSLCREFFMRSLLLVHKAVKDTPNVDLIGQFHDEIVLDWQPSMHPDSINYESAEYRLMRAMSNNTFAPSFLLEADIKSAYRYIK